MKTTTSAGTTYGIEVQDDGMVRIVRTRNGQTSIGPALTPAQTRYAIDGMRGEALEQARAAFSAIYG
jgi:hypothetical protein